MSCTAITRPPISCAPRSPGSSNGTRWSHAILSGYGWIDDCRGSGGGDLANGRKRAMRLIPNGPSGPHLAASSRTFPYFLSQRLDHLHAPVYSGQSARMLRQTCLTLELAKL